MPSRIVPAFLLAEPMAVRMPSFLSVLRSFTLPGRISSGFFSVLNYCFS